MSVIPNMSNGRSFTPPTMMPRLPPLAPSVGTLSDTGAVAVRLSDSAGQPRSHASSIASAHVSTISATHDVVNVEIRRDGGTNDSFQHTKAFIDWLGRYPVSGINGAPSLNESEKGDGSQDFGKKQKKQLQKILHHPPQQGNTNTVDLHRQ